MRLGTQVPFIDAQFVNQILVGLVGLLVVAARAHRGHCLVRGDDSTPRPDCLSAVAAISPRYLSFPWILRVAALGLIVSIILTCLEDALQYEVRLLLIS